MPNTVWLLWYGIYEPSLIGVFSDQATAESAQKVFLAKGYNDEKLFVEEEKLNEYLSP